MPNSKLQEISEQLIVVKAFQERYVSPDVFPVRVYGLDLNYQALQCEVMAKSCVKVGEIQPYARLEV